MIDKGPKSAFLKRILDQRSFDHDVNAADQFSKKMVIGKVTTMIG